MTVKYFYSNDVSGIKVIQSRAPEMVSFGTAMISGIAMSKKKKKSLKTTKCVLLPGEKEKRGENLLGDSH